MFCAAKLRKQQMAFTQTESFFVVVILKSSTVDPHLSELTWTWVCSDN